MTCRKDFVKLIYWNNEIDGFLETREGQEFNLLRWIRDNLKVKDGEHIDLIVVKR